MYATFEFYTNSFHGSVLTESEFARAATRASSFLDYYTRGKANSEDDFVKMACCAVAELYKEDGVSGVVQSESVGSWSRTYHENACGNVQKQAATLARQYVSHLLYRGGCCR